VDRKLNRTYVEPVPAIPYWDTLRLNTPVVLPRSEHGFSDLLLLGKCVAVTYIELLVPVTNNARGSFVVFFFIFKYRARTVKIIVDVVAGHVNATINTRRNPF
jgi:hypothetical protein